jgi:hypothetical protein
MAGWATARASSDQLAALRKIPVVPADKELVAGFLKNSDDQTVLALTVVSRAMGSLKRPTASYHDWGILAAANLFGRSGTFQSLSNYRKDGAWGITPHMIPHHSLHALSGTISQTLGIHGPNFGIGGGPKAAAEAFLAAATIISENRLPGLWVLMSGHDPECLPSAAYPDRQVPTTCLAAAIALEPLVDSNFTSYLRVWGGCDPPADWPEFNLADFLNALETKIPRGRWTLPGCGRVLLGAD